MGNIKIQGEARITILRPYTKYVNGENVPSRMEQLRTWSNAVVSAVFSSELVHLLTRIEFSWKGDRGNDAHIDMLIPYEWDASKIRKFVNELAEKAYADCSTSLRAEIERDREDGPERPFAWPRVSVQWIQKEVA